MLGQHPRFGRLLEVVAVGEQLPFAERLPEERNPRKPPEFGLPTPPQRGAPGRPPPPRPLTQDPQTTRCRVTSSLRLDHTIAPLAIPRCADPRRSWGVGGQR